MLALGQVRDGALRAGADRGLQELARGVPQRHDLEAERGQSARLDIRSFGLSSCVANRCMGDIPADAPQKVCASSTKAAHYGFRLGVSTLVRTHAVTVYG